MPHNIQKVFLTGANGFVACHILSDLIKAGYLPTAAVRSKAKSEEILNAHPEWKDIVRFAYIPDLTVPGAFDEAIKLENNSLSYITHTASPVTMHATDIQKQIIDPAVKGTTSLLKSVNEYGGPQVKGEKDWNPVTSDMAIGKQSIVFGYCAAKTLGEKAAWKFLRDNKTSFDMTVLLPVVVIGPMLHNVSTPERVNESNRFPIYNFLDGTRTDTEAWGVPFYHFVDVRDVSRAHILSLDSPATSNQRVQLGHGLITPQLVVNIIRKNFPELKSRVPEGNPSQVVPDGVNISRWNNEKSYQVLGKDWTYKDLETSVVDTVNDILRREKEWQK